jgi:SNARE protein
MPTLYTFFLTGTEILQIVNPHNKDIRDIPGLAPPAQTRRLLYVRTGEHFD